MSEQILVLLRERGPLTVEEIAYYLGRDVREIVEEIQYMEHDKLVTRVKKGLIIKREVFDLTPTGLKETQRTYEKLRGVLEGIIGSINTISNEKLEELLNQYVSLIPLMIILNLVPLELLMLMGLTYC